MCIKLAVLHDDGSLGDQAGSAGVEGVEGLKPHSLNLCPSQWGLRDWIIYATGSKQNLNVMLI